MGGNHRESPERKIGKAGIKRRFGVPGEETAAQARLVLIVPLRPARSHRAPSGADAPADRHGRLRPAAARRGYPLPDWRYGWIAAKSRSAATPSTSVATLTSEANGWPVLRSMVASVPARVARNRLLATAVASKSAAGGAFSGSRSGMKPGKAVGRLYRTSGHSPACRAAKPLPRPAIAPISPCLVTLPPLHGFSKAYGPGQSACLRPTYARRPPCRPSPSSMTTAIS